jgi:hypothetical protein
MLVPGQACARETFFTPDFPARNGRVFRRAGEIPMTRAGRVPTNCPHRGKVTRRAKEAPMLRHAKQLEKYELRARDGKIGHVQDFFFDDRSWTVRYLVVDTGSWLNSRRVLISPTAVSGAEWERKLLPVNLTREQVRGSPGVETETPVSREQEVALTQYYNWPAYWGAAGFPDVGFAVHTLPVVPPEVVARDAARRAGSAVEQEHHLRSVRAVTGHAIEATDGAIGHVDDFLIDDRSWAIRYVVVDTRNWWPGKKVVIAPEWIHEVGWDEAKVFVDLARDTIKAGPAYDPATELTPGYAGKLHEHYGRPPPTAFF